MPAPGVGSGRGRVLDRPGMPQTTNDRSPTVGGMIGGSDAARYAIEHWDPSRLPAPLEPDTLADGVWELFSARDRFERTIRG